MDLDDGTISKSPIEAMSYSTDITANVVHSPENGGNCSDIFGNVITDGMQYVPDEDPCRTCHCHSGHPIMCKSVQCSPPTCRFVEMIKTECCKFICIDLPHDTDFYRNGTRIFDSGGRDANRATFGVRLVASIITSLIVIILLVFMVHRLRRRRRAMISMRRLNSERRSENEDLVYMTNADNVDIAFDLPPYEDLPPPYSPAKQCRIVDESPPPYEPPSGSGEAHSVWQRTRTTTDESNGSLANAEACSESIPLEILNPRNSISFTDGSYHNQVDHNGNAQPTSSFSPSSDVCASDASEAGTLQSIVRVLNNGCHASQLLREGFEMSTFSGNLESENRRLSEARELHIAADASFENGRNNANFIMRNDTQASNYAANRVRQPNNLHSSVNLSGITSPSGDASHDGLRTTQMDTCSPKHRCSAAEKLRSLEIHSRGMWCDL